MESFYFWGKAWPNFFLSLSPPSALHLDSRSSFQDFGEPPCPLRSRGEEEEDEAAGVFSFSLSLFFSLSIDQLTAD